MDIRESSAKVAPGVTLVQQTETGEVGSLNTTDQVKDDQTCIIGYRNIYYNDR